MNIRISRAVHKGKEQGRLLKVHNFALFFLCEVTRLTFDLHGLQKYNSFIRIQVLQAGFSVAYGSPVQ